MRVLLPDHEAYATYSIRGEPPMDDDEYYEFCMKNPELRIEREANGEIVIMPPTKPDIATAI
ncbi:MAG TPA: Uma2 family endonuclease [Bryobacteraceae bacterium]|nr:Uma2 family endonuclease [Bryobacteraceae bacterium]